MRKHWGNIKFGFEVLSKIWRKALFLVVAIVFARILVLGFVDTDNYRMVIEFVFLPLVFLFLIFVIRASNEIIQSKSISGLYESIYALPDAIKICLYTLIGMSMWMFWLIIPPLGAKVFPYLLFSVPSHVISGKKGLDAFRYSDSLSKKSVWAHVGWLFSVFIVIFLGVFLLFFALFSILLLISFVLPSFVREFLTYWIYPHISYGVGLYFLIPFIAVYTKRYVSVLKS